MNYVGKNIPLTDAWAKATGTAEYVCDMEIPNMLYASMIFSPYPHCTVESVDDSEALKIPGVFGVYHCFNTPPDTFNRFRTFYGQKVYNQERIFNKHLKFVGDRAAAVLADNAETAEKAAKLVSIKYKKLPYSLDIKTTEQGVIDDIFSEGSVYNVPQLEIGNFTETENPDIVKTATHTEMQRLAHICIETHCCIADYKSSTKELIVYTPTQSVFSLRTVLGDLLKIPYHKIRVVKTTMGGSFGCKQEWVLEPVAAYLATVAKRPVKLNYNRKDDMISTVSRAPITGDVISYIMPDGTIKGLEVNATVDAGGYIGNSYDYALAMGYKYTRNYRIPYLKYNSRAVITNTPVSGAFRGWTSPEATLMLEHNLDTAAKKLNMDSIDIRLKNAYNENDIDNRINVSLENTQIIRCLKEGRKIFEWDKRKFACQKQTGRYRTGIGVACGGHVNGYFPRKQDFATTTISSNEDGTVNILVSLHDHGCGTVTCFKAMAADCLGIKREDILIKEADTAYTPFDMGCFSSRTTYVIGNSLLNCCKKLIEQILANASKIYNTNIEYLTYKNGIVYNQGKKLTSFKEISRDSIIVCQKQLYATADYINKSNPGVHGVHFAQVEADTYTGHIKVTDYLAVHDIGKAINKGICKAQIQGAVNMGIGAALKESLIINKNGSCKGSLKDYHVINCFETPKINIHLIEEPCEHGPFGAKSIGEVCFVPVSAVIVNAVNNALNTDICTIPMTPDLIMKELCAKGGLKGGL